MARKTKEEALATRELLLDAAARLFSRNGVSGTALHDIAREAGLTRGAVYWHFSNKVELLMALWERAALPIRETFERAAEDPQLGALDLIRYKACWLSEHIEHDERLLEIMSILMLRCEYSGETEGARGNFLLIRDECLACVVEDFRRAIALGELAPTVEPQHAAIALLGLADGICFHWLIAPDSFPIARTVRTAVDAYLRGLAKPDSK
ncbi:MAG: TetR family transcriptional regulator [Candidatus Dactylopiibacterium sp.]|nr:TetR family transcriptional regulator [Candidatus Dactylopiibacterium sp.]